MWYTRQYIELIAAGGVYLLCRFTYLWVNGV
jgi:hypothetical protein